MRLLNKYTHLLLLFFIVLPFLACSGKYIGWGVLLWNIDDPGIPSGAVLPVQVRSSIEQAWIVGVPEEFKADGRETALVPLPHLQLFSSKRKAKKYAASIAEYAITYAETVQDGLPIREKPENNARRVYRLKKGEVIKILERAKGVEAISASGNPLEGEWYKVLTYSGSTGYCFSYRLRMFEQESGELSAEAAKTRSTGDEDLDIVLSQSWYPKEYKEMVEAGHIDLDYLGKNYSFTAGVIDNKARVHLEKGTSEYRYQKISKTKDRSWVFDNTPLSMTLLSGPTLQVEWDDQNGVRQRETFYAIDKPVETLVAEEREKRQTRYQNFMRRGPRYFSNNYGTITFNANGTFTWDGLDTLPQGLLPEFIAGNGRVDLEYTIVGEMAERYTGALALNFNAISGSGARLVFAYTLNNQGLRMELIPGEYVSGRAVSRRAASPFSIYFSSR